jgi:hypothetical protein
MSSLAATDRLIDRSPDTAAAAVRAIVKTQAALKEDAGRATQVGRKLFPLQEAELIAELIRRDLPYYDPSISPSFVTGMNQFARDIGILEGQAKNVVATHLAGPGGVEHSEAVGRSKSFAKRRSHQLAASIGSGQLSAPATVVPLRSAAAPILPR